MTKRKRRTATNGHQLTQGCYAIANGGKPPDHVYGKHAHVDEKPGGKFAVTWTKKESSVKTNSIRTGSEGRE